MIATISGSPSAPARANDCGVPPTPSQIGSGFCSGLGVDALTGQRRPKAAGPMHVFALTDCQEQIELLGEERVIVLQPKAKERERLDGRAAADHHFRAALRQQIEGRELLKHADGIGRAQDRHRARETDAARSGGGCGQNDGRRRVEVLLAMVFPDPEGVQAGLIGVLDLFDQVQQPVRGADGAAGLEIRRREAVNSDLHRCLLWSATQCRPGEAAARWQGYGWRPGPAAHRDGCWGRSHHRHLHVEEVEEDERFQQLTQAA
jgi:hypothetical protein